MENNELIIPFQIESIKRRNFISKWVFLTKEYIKNLVTEVLKRFIALIGIIFLIPLTVLIKLRKIANNDKTKIFKVEEKIGKKGKIFKRINFEISEKDNFLMKSGLNHYPEIINVFLGQMNFVGPKAYDACEKEKMGEYYTYIIQHKPGITGVNQISSNSKISFEDRLDNDLRYHYRECFLLKLKIILITFFVTLRKKDTYSNILDQLEKSTNDFKILIRESVKRIIDIIAGLVGIIILIPITILIKIGNMICGDFGKVFYTQDRIGKNGKIFKIYKFRSMVENADEKLKELLENDESVAEEFRKNQKLKNDPRITTVGKIIRKTSIDELPQLINVFIGDMSLVGPRPYLPREKEKMGGDYDLIIKSKPGITGLWQVSGRSNTTFDSRLRFDRQYNREKSLKTDTKILIKTVGVVLKGEGAV